MSYNWKFFKSARCVQVKLETGADIAALAELDQKLWTVLSAPAEGLRFDPATLKLLDADSDGRIRVPEVLAAVAWMKCRFRNLDFLFAARDELALSDLDESTPEGKALLTSLKNILARAGKADATAISLADAVETVSVFNSQPFNGDGVITVKSTPDAKLSAVVGSIIAAEGAVADRSGEDGVDQAKVDAFFADAKAYADWKSAENGAQVLGEGTAAAYAAFSAVETAIDSYFTPPEDLPLIADDPTPSVPLTEGVNPLWQAKFAEFAASAAAPALGREFVESITRGEWAEIKAKLAPYGAWLAAKAGEKVAGVENVAELVADASVQTAVNDLIGKDLALADEYARLVDCERALRYSRHLADWLQNFVNQANIYDPSRESVFHTGTLYIDGRACSLCFHVADEGAHAALAEKSRCCLLYVKLSRKATGEAREICAVVTAGSTVPLYAGRNGLFYDCDGKDWDAVVSKVVEAQVSLREAFWAPWAKIAGTISEQCKKFLSSKQDAAVAKVGDGISSAASAPAPAAPAAPSGANAAALASSVAALGVGVGMAGAACAALVGLVAGLPLWKVLAGVAAIILLVSLPSVILAWFKLRARDLGAILNAGGWAVNRPLNFSIGLARTFTHPASMPKGAMVARDPYASRAWIKWLLVFLLLAGAAAGAVCYKYGLFNRQQQQQPQQQSQPAAEAGEKAVWVQACGECMA